MMNTLKHDFSDHGEEGLFGTQHYKDLNGQGSYSTATWEQLRLLTNRLQDFQEEAYSRLSQDIQEMVGQSITALKLDLFWLEKKMGEQVPEVAGRLQTMNKRIDNTLSTVRHIASQMRPGILDDMGIVEAIEWQTWHFSRQNKIQTKFFSFHDHIELDQKRTTAIYRIFQEILTNIFNHADASKVWVSIHDVAGYIVLQVKDDGRGIRDVDMENPSKTGILNMRERARGLNGKVYIFGVEVKGATTLVRSPTGKEVEDDVCAF